MTSTTIRAAVIALLLPISAAAIAQAPAQTPPPPGAEAPIGGNYDGAMTLAQFQARQAQRMMTADTDGDGRISLAEWTAQMDARRGGGGRGGYDPAQMFARMDTNHDGFIDKAEIDAASAERFRRMDANGDGVVSADERAAMRGGGMHGHGDHRGPADGGDQPPPSTPQS